MSATAVGLVLPRLSRSTVAADRYLFDHRNANVSINGQTFVEWFVDEYYGGPAGIGNKNIIGFCRSNGDTS